jgi:flavorubredoxin
MTIAFAAQVNDGIVLATDSATTMTQGDKIINIYDNANKAFNLHKSLPIGIITWGAGNIGRQSIASIVKDFRKVIMDHEEVKIDILNYSVEQVATMFFEGIKLLNINEAVKESSLGL